MQKQVKFFKAGLLVWLLFFGFAGIANLSAQTALKANYDKTTQVLSLDESGAFGYLFELDIRPMNFASQRAADEFFSNWTTELVSFQVDFAKRKAEVMLNTRSQSDWGAKEWNTYLAELPKQ
jgi:hypothetical protein